MGGYIHNQKLGVAVTPDLMEISVLDKRIFVKDISVDYDPDRRGWIIKQRSDDPPFDWKEVSFIGDW